MIVINNQVIFFPKKSNTRSYQIKLHLHLSHNTEHSVLSDYGFKFVIFFSSSSTTTMLLLLRFFLIHPFVNCKLMVKTFLIKKVLYPLVL